MRGIAVIDAKSPLKLLRRDRDQRHSFLPCEKSERAFGELRRMLRWMKQLTKAFGLPFLWLVCLIYFTQGFRSFVWTSVSYLLKDRLKLSPSASQFVLSVVFAPWSVKPLYGILSDCFPIRGRKRIPYLLIATVLSFVPWIILGLDPNSRSSELHLIILLTVQNLGSAMSDVVVDAMIAEATRLERASFSGDLQSVSWLAMACGGVCGSLLGGLAQTNLEIDRIFLLFSVLPAMQLFSCGLVKENALGDNFSDVSKSSDFSSRNGTTAHLLDATQSKRSKKVNASRRKQMQTKSKMEEVLLHDSLASKKIKSSSFNWLQSMKTATYTLFNAFRQPMILRPMAWFFLSQITIPNLSTVMFYYQTEFLNLDASFLGTARVIGWLGLMLGTFIYNRYLKAIKLRKILACAHVGLALISILDVVLVSRTNTAFGISDKTMVLCGSALADAINQFKFMPFLILSAQLCPPGIEGTLFALFMSINNLGSTVGSFVGAGLASVLNLSSGSFDNLLIGIAVQVFCTVIPIALLFLIPKDVTGIAD